MRPGPGLVLGILLLVPIPSRGGSTQAPRESPDSTTEALAREMSLLETLDRSLFEMRRAEARIRSAREALKVAENRRTEAEAALEAARSREDEARGRLQAGLRVLRASAPLMEGPVQALWFDDPRLPRRVALLERLARDRAEDLRNLARAGETARVQEFRARIEAAMAWLLTRDAEEARERLARERALHLSILESLRRNPAVRQRAAREWDRTLRDLQQRVERMRSAVRGPVDFEALKGKVPSPLPGGRILHRFGPLAHPVFHTRVQHPGLTLEVPGTAPRRVQAVAFGQVAWTGTAPGIGLTVLLDHASGWFTVYGGLDSVTCREGDVVRAGDVLGTTRAGPGERSARLHFEMRRQGQPVDPVPYLSRGGTRR